MDIEYVAFDGTINAATGETSTRLIRSTVTVEKTEAPCVKVLVTETQKPDVNPAVMSFYAEYAWDAQGDGK